MCICIFGTGTVRGGEWAERGVGGGGSGRRREWAERFVISLFGPHRAGMGRKELDRNDFGAAGGGGEKGGKRREVVGVCG